MSNSGMLFIAKSVFISPKPLIPKMTVAVITSRESVTQGIKQRMVAGNDQI